jgi:protein arginine N-methyltransferase 1
MPDKASLYVATVEDESYKNSKIHFWDSVYNVNMSCIKKWALFEPIVDGTNYESINSDFCPIFDIDIKTVTKEELDFASEYKLNITRKDCIHGILAYFDVYFTKGHQTITLSTSPFTTETHWKQTTFYLHDVLKVFKGDVLTGSIAVKKSKKNIRELDVKISVHLKNSIHKDYNAVHVYKIC